MSRPTDEELRAMQARIREAFAINPDPTPAELFEHLGIKPKPEPAAPPTYPRAREGGAIPASVLRTAEGISKQTGERVDVVLKRMAGLLKAAVGHASKGGKVIFRNADGSEKALKVRWEL